MKNRLVSLCMLAVLAGCTSTRPSHFYTLAPTATAGGASAGYAVAVGPVSVPGVVDRPQIVIRTGPNQVDFDEFNRWASPLKDEIARVVAENLAGLLGTPQVTVFPKSANPDAACRVAIDVLAFESEPGKAATLDALWTASGGTDGRLLRRRTTVVEPAHGGYADLAAAHSRSLGRLSAEIAAAVREMEAQKK